MMGRLVTSVKHHGGVVVEYGGTYWSDGYNTGQEQMDRGFGGLDKASVHNPEFCLRPTYVIHESQLRHYPELELARLLPVLVTTQVTIWKPEEDES